MTAETLIKQIEAYSNAIVAFVALQGLAYSYAFGTNQYFNCLVKTATHLASGLTILFALVTVLAIIAIAALGRTIRQLSGDFRGVVTKIYLGKVVAALIFSLVPLVLTYAYGVRDYPNKAACERAAQSRA